MKDLIKSFFNYSQNEKRGIFILLVLIIFGFLFPKIHSTFKKDEIVDYSEFEAQIDKFITSKTYDIGSTKTKVLKSFNFDPNTLDKKGFLKLGLSEKVVSTVFKYRKNGGHFYKPADFKKIYGITDSEYTRLSPYIKIEHQTKSIANSYKSNTTQPISYSKKSAKIAKDSSFQIELNNADSSQLVKIRGIGPVFAHRIIKYRNYLGGYYSISQLTEVYGFSEELFLETNKYFQIDTSLIKKININIAAFKVVNKHPYLTYKQTKAIFAYRQTMNTFNSLNDLIENNLLDSISYDKVKPYITLVSLN